MKFFKNITILTLGLLYIIIGIKHFTETNFFIPIVPPFISFKKEVVLVSGLLEIILGLFLLFKKTRRVSAYGIIILLIAVFPANIYLFISETPRIILGISQKQALIRMPFQIPLILIAFWHSSESHSNFFSLICSVLFLPTIIYFLLLSS